MFLFGMSLMGDSLKKVAGDKLEIVLYQLTSTPLRVCCWARASPL